jgi:hypothetical protein
MTGREKLPRARLEASYFSLALSSIKISLGFLFSKILFFAFSQPVLPKPVAIRQRSPFSTSLQGTVSIVTGANSGIGYEIAKEQFQRGSRVILACRNEKRANDAKARILKECGISSSGGAGAEKDGHQDRLEIFILNCTLLKDVRKFVQSWQHQNQGSNKGTSIDYLFLNAGIVDKPQNGNRFTEEGFEVI